MTAGGGLRGEAAVSIAWWGSPDSNANIQQRKRKNNLTIKQLLNGIDCEDRDDLFSRHKILS